MPRNYANMCEVKECADFDHGSVCNLLRYTSVKNNRLPPTKMLCSILGQPGAALEVP